MNKKYVVLFVLTLLLSLLTGCAGGAASSVDDLPGSTAAAPGTVTIFDSGKPETILLQPAQATVANVTIAYAWASHGGELYVQNQTEGCHLERIPGSDELMYALLGGSYAYLVNAQTGEVQDPLAALEQEILDYLSLVSFSPDGQYALVSYAHGTALILLNCQTGEKTQLPYGEGLYAVSGGFLDSGTVLVTSAYEGTDGQITYSLARYAISDATHTELPGRYVSKDKTAENFLCCIEGPFAYTHTDGKLTIVDLRTMEEISSSLDLDAVTKVSYCTADSVLITADGMQYLWKTDGSMQKIG